MKFTGKSKVGNTTCNIVWLDWSEMAKQFSVYKLMRKIYLPLSGNEASKHLASSFPFSDF